MIAKRHLRLWLARRNTQRQKVSQIEPDSHQVALIVDAWMQKLKMEAMKDVRSHLAVPGANNLAKAEIAICQFEQRRFLLELMEDCLRNPVCIR